MNWLFFALATAVLWSVGQVFLKKSYSKITPLWVCLIDLPVYLALFIPVSLVNGASLAIPLSESFLILGISVLNLLYYYALEKGKLSISATLMSAYPAVTVILSRMFLGEKLNYIQYFSVFSIILGGVLLGIVGNKSKSKRRGDAGSFLLPVATALLLGISDFATKAVITRNGVNTYNLWLPIMNIIAVSIFWAFDRKGRKMPAKKGFGSVIFTLGGVVFTTLGFLTLNFAFSHGPASLVTPVSSGYVALTVLLAYFFLRERISTVQKYGIILIILGIFTLGSI